MRMKYMGEVMPNMEALTLGDRDNSEGEALIIVSYEDACLYTSSHDSDRILDYGASYHATPSKDNFISLVIFVRFTWVIKSFVILKEYETF